MNVYTTEVVDVSVVEEEVNDVAGAEAVAEDEVKISIHYLFHMVMELLLLKLRYMIKVNINNCPEINKLKFKNSTLRLVGSVDIPCLMKMF